MYGKRSLQIEQIEQIERRNAGRPGELSGVRGNAGFTMTLILVRADSRQRLWQGDASAEDQASNGALLCHCLVNRPRLR